MVSSKTCTLASRLKLRLMSSQCTALTSCSSLSITCEHEQSPALLEVPFHKQHSPFSKNIHCQGGKLAPAKFWIQVAAMGSSWSLPKSFKGRADQQGVQGINQGDGNTALGVMTSAADGSHIILDTHPVS